MVQSLLRHGPERVSFFFFFFSKNIGPAAAGPAPAPLLSSFSSVSPLFWCVPLGAYLLPLHLCLLRHCTLGSSSSTSLL